MLFTYLTTLIVHSIKKIHETYWCYSSISCREERTEWIFRIFTFNDKNSLYLWIILTLQFLFEDQSDQGVTQLVIKPFGISQASRIVSLSLKKCWVFPNPVLFFIYFFRQYLTQILRPISLPPLSMLFANIWDSFLAQNLLLLLCLYAANIE